jgi:histone deacetylase 1/2
MSFPSPFYPSTTLKLNNMLHVPSITKNLVSVSQFARDNNVFFEFHSNVCYVKSQDSSRILLKGHLGNDGFYLFASPTVSKHAASTLPNPKPSFTISQSSCNNVESASTSTSSIPSQSFQSLSTFQCNNVDFTKQSTSSTQNLHSMYTIWHNRLGHPHHEVLKAIMKLCNKNIPNKTF